MFAFLLSWGLFGLMVEKIKMDSVVHHRWTHRALKTLGLIMDWHLVRNDYRIDLDYRNIHTICFMICLLVSADAR
jgi:hypothetical protein